MRRFFWSLHTIVSDSLILNIIIRYYIDVYLYLDTIIYKLSKFVLETTLRFSERATIVIVTDDKFNSHEYNVFIPLNIVGQTRETRKKCATLIK